MTVEQVPRKQDPRYGTYRWKLLRAFVLERDGRVCRYCQGAASTVDHIVPPTRGGDFWAEENLCAACQPCNSGKGDRLPAGYRRREVRPFPYTCTFHGGECGAVHSRDW